MDLEKFIEVAENLEVKGLKGDKSKSSGAGGRPTTIPVSDVQDALAHKRKITAPAWQEVNEPQFPPAKVLRSQALISQDRQQSIAPHLQQQKPVPSPSQVNQRQPEPSPGTLTGDVLIKEEVEEDGMSDVHDVMKSTSGVTFFSLKEEGEWDENSSNAAEGMEGEPETPMNIPPEVDPQTVFYVKSYVWCGKIQNLGTKVYFCPVCPYLTPNKGHAEYHSRKHSKERPFQCPICFKSYTQKSHLRSHCAVQHPNNLQELLLKFFHSCEILKAQAMSNKYNLKWNSHHAETFQSFESLRHREMFVDVNLSCNGQLAKAHKLVLCAGSGYFERILNKDGSGTPTVHFYGVEMHLLKLLVEFMYCGEVEVPALDLEKFIEVAENLEVKGLKGDKSKSSGAGGRPTTIPVSDVQDALAHKRKSTFSAWQEFDEPQFPPTKMARSQSLLPRSKQQSIGPRFQQSKPVPSHSQFFQSEPEASTSTSTDEVLIKEEGDETSDAHDVIDSNSASTGEEEWNENSSYVAEGIEGEPDAPMNIPSDVDPQTVFYVQSFVWCGKVQRTGTKLYFCPVCPYSTGNKGHAEYHSHKHSKEKPYQCPICFKSFSRKWDLKTHCVEAQAMSNKYNLKWNSHHAETFQSFENLRHREMFVDVILSCNGQLAKAHKLVLCAGSGYFERILNKDGSGTPTIHFYGVEMHLLKLLVEFMYCGEVEVPAMDLEKFIEVAENLEVKGLKGDKSKSSGAGGRPTSIPVSDVQDALAHKRKSTFSAWQEFDEPQFPPAKMARSLSLLPRGKQQSIASRFQQPKPVLSPTQFFQSEPEASTSTSTDEVLIKEEGEDETSDAHDVIDSTSVATEEGEWDESTSYVAEGMEGEPETPMNIPPDVDPQTVSYVQSYVWSGKMRVSGTKLYFCPVCPYSTINKGHADYHSRKHSKEKPFQCPVCFKFFSQRSCVRTHCAMQHSSDFEGLQIQ
ncbi:unnamed protein product [Darwinula stevensoni]|uniref:Uncharacterized protein n=1 Tax=Darwinula stevensoni TaxID=69355 RepID=A0A7R8XAM7_9CRUS|nr:unnamed protein product [Darwinula stevensoni]CAG0892065.1 unnamed protein product [Darwinula stevensoni]